MRTDTPKPVYLKDYKPYPYALAHVRLNFDIHEGYTDVTAEMRFALKPEAKPGAPLILHGESLELHYIKYNEVVTDQYEADEEKLTLIPQDETFTLEIKTRIKPEENTRLEGLYKSGDSYCTQCEAEGFRRITYYPDRPDVMSTFTTRIEADKEKYPVLLSNGNCTDKGESEGGRHFTIWSDPWPKPCYLFALVAGNLAHIKDSFTTKSGRNVDLYIYVRPGDEAQCSHAMESLKKSMKWEEEVYGLEYDLDIFNIVAVSDFNMGAMENKSLNIFNTALVLAQQETATDQDFIRVESVIAHEYFHNWSGNRVTCRDWFQLSLKEGLTVFRDQEFSSDMNSRPVQRIDDVQHLRRMQFAEDAGPLAHPIRPDNYIEINNFYTMTVYEKGAEVIRMMHTLLGAERYRKATDLYFERHDGQAATCDDFIKAMEDGGAIDLSQFRLWYEQAGTPSVTYSAQYDEAARTYTIEMSQSTPPTQGQPTKKPMHIPVRLGLLSDNGADMREELLEIREEKQVFVLENVPSKPIPSILRGFSAPVKLTHDLSDEELAFLMVHDTDGFNQWEAGQTYFLRVLNQIINVIPTEVEGSHSIDEDHSTLLGMTLEKFLKTYSALLERALDPQSDKALMARAMSLPDVQAIGQSRDVVDPDAIHAARYKLEALIVDKCGDALRKIYDENAYSDEFSITPAAMGQRALRNKALSLLTCQHGDKDAALIQSHYEQANNMTERMAALVLAAEMDHADAKTVVNDFYGRFKDYELVVNKWFSAQAMAVSDNSIQNIKKLEEHADFNIKNPNRVRALYAAFAMNNPVMFHKVDGSGYELLKDAVIRLNTINPQIAARLLTPLREWRRYTPDRQDKMKAALSDILSQDNLSPDVYEIAKKSLDA